jgi:hypothetical protein
MVNEPLPTPKGIFYPRGGDPGVAWGPGWNFSQPNLNAPQTLLFSAVPLAWAVLDPAIPPKFLAALSLA